MQTKPSFTGSNWTGKTNRTSFDAFGYDDPEAFKEPKKSYAKFIAVVVFCVYAAAVITIINY